MPLAASAAAPEKKENVGKTNAGGTQVEWQIGVDSEKILLSVSGPDGTVYEKVFPAGKNPVMRMQDGPNKTLPDGSYMYQLRVVPRISDDVKKKLSDARAKNDDAEVSNILHTAGIGNTVVQSGAFLIKGGMMVSSDAIEPTARTIATARKGTSGVTTDATKGKIATNDQVIADDLIVQGSECVGLDCVVNESFGFDTLRLKENNTRIKFEDTSTSTGFPTTDWQLTANDSASGGANKFSIEDITDSTVPFTITGLAPTNSIFVDSTGRLGLRTSTPGLDVHISTGNTPAIRQEQTSTGGFTAQTWDIGANEANWFVRDVTGGSRLPLRIRPGAATSSIDISAASNVGIGTATNSLYGKLQVSSTNPGMIGTFGTDFVPLGMYHNGGRTALFYNAYNDTGDKIFFGTNRAASSEFNVSTGLFEIKSSTAAGAAGTATTLASRIAIDSSGNIGIGTSSPTSPITHSNGATLSAGGVWTNASSRTLKQDICDLTSDDARSALNELNPVTYAYKVAPAEHHVGFIAEDVPDLVATQDRKGLSSMDVVAVLAKVVKDQQKTIDTLSQRLEQLEKNKQ